MKIENIKKMVTLPDFLKKIGREPIRRNGDFLHYRSPFREDKKPSFWVNIKTGKCGDFAEGGEIGDIINLAARWYNCDIKTAINNLEDCLRVGHFSFEKPYIPKETTNKVHITHIQPLQNAALLQYLSGRGITPEVAKVNLQEVYYKTKDNDSKQYFAVAFRNDKGGYELRNKYFKGSTTPKAPTTIKNNSETVVIFEGFMDYLSCIEYWNSLNQTLPYDVIVLNSVVFARTLKLHTYKSIKLFLDSDSAGQNTANIIEIENGADKVINLTPKFIPKGCKDFNDFWMNEIKNKK